MKTLFLVCLNTILLTCYSQSAKEFTITGDVSTVKDKITKVHYRYYLNALPVDDSAIVSNRRYILRGKIDEHVMLSSKAEYADTSLHYDYRMNYNVVHVLPGTNATVIHGDKFSSSTITNSPAQDEYNTLHARLVKGETNFLPGYLKQNPNSPIAIFLLNQFILGPFPEIGHHEPLYNSLSAQNKNSPSGKRLANRFTAIRTLAIGKPAPDISQKDSTGKVITLSSLRGKYVLVEFWASWCAPCRRENPQLVKLYHQYKDKNFEILGVSVDDSRKSWLKAVYKDQLPWINTADLLDMDKNPAALTYAVTGVPFNVLVDPGGKIVGKVLKGEELEKRLEELLGR